MDRFFPVRIRWDYADDDAHPAFVHFPIALLAAILVFYCLGTWLKWPSLLIAGRATLYLAFFSLIIVVYTGLRARSAPSNEAIEAIMQTHKNTFFFAYRAVDVRHSRRLDRGERERHYRWNCCRFSHRSGSNVRRADLRRIDVR